MSDTNERPILHYAVVRPTGYHYPKAILAVDTVSDKTVTGVYAHDHLSYGEGAVSVPDREVRWSPARAAGRVPRYRLPKAQVLADYPTFDKALEAFNRGAVVADMSAFVDRTRANELDVKITAARDRQSAARIEAEILLQERGRIYAEAVAAQGLAVRRAMGLPMPEHPTQPEELTDGQT